MTKPARADSKSPAQIARAERLATLTAARAASAQGREDDAARLFALVGISYVTARAARAAQEGN